MVLCGGACIPLIFQELMMGMNGGQSKITTRTFSNMPFRGGILDNSYEI